MGRAEPTRKSYSLPFLSHSRFMSGQTTLVALAPRAGLEPAITSPIKPGIAGSLPIVRRIHDRAQLARLNTPGKITHDRVGRDLRGQREH